MQIKFVAHYFKKAFLCRPLCADSRAAVYDIQIIKVDQFEGISWEQRKQKGKCGTGAKMQQKKAEMRNKINKYLTKLFATQIIISVNGNNSGEGKSCKQAMKGRKEGKWKRGKYLISLVLVCVSAGGGLFCLHCQQGRNNADNQINCASVNLSAWVCSHK